MEDTNMDTKLEWVVRGLNHDGSVEMFYTGRAGKNWLAAGRENGFTYQSKESAQSKAKNFNRMEPLHGFYFHATTSH